MAFDFGNEEKKNKLTDSLKKTLDGDGAKRSHKTTGKVGRPKGRTKVTVTFSLKPATRDKLRKIANDNGYPAVSEFLENLINDESFRSDIVWSSELDK